MKGSNCDKEGMEGIKIDIVAGAVGGNIGYGGKEIVRMRAYVKGRLILLTDLVTCSAV